MGSLITPQSVSAQFQGFTGTFVSYFDWIIFQGSLKNAEKHAANGANTHLPSRQIAKDFHSQLIDLRNDIEDSFSNSRNGVASISDKNAHLVSLEMTRLEFLGRYVMLKHLKAARQNHSLRNHALEKVELTKQALSILRHVDTEEGIANHWEVRFGKGADRHRKLQPNEVLNDNEFSETQAVVLENFVKGIYPNGIESNSIFQQILHGIASLPFHARQASEKERAFIHALHLNAQSIGRRLNRNYGFSDHIYESRPDDYYILANDVHDFGDLIGDCRAAIGNSYGNNADAAALSYRDDIADLIARLYSNGQQNAARALSTFVGIRTNNGARLGATIGTFATGAVTLFVVAPDILLDLLMGG